MPSFLGISAIVIVLSIGVIGIHGKPRQIKPGCRYENRRYQEGDPVNTSEPCLQCRCVDGSLRCRLRVCPRLPNPSPPGCYARPPGENVCCPELVCRESPHDADNVLRRIAGAEPAEKVEDDGCSFEGVRYGPGSAMMGTGRCEYCYCILGARSCVRPRCLLPLPGCTPLYAPYSCCPVAYNCTHHESPATLSFVSGNGCRVGERRYEEGEMVRDVEWKAACDNCFCAMGKVRCVPLACAPPLQGCSPIVREGQCCPSTYNCSGSIEVKATQNYASYAFISKDYAKFRKETNFFPADNNSKAIPTNASGEARGHRVVDRVLMVPEGGEASSATPEEVSTTSEPTTPSTSTHFQTETMDNEILPETTECSESTTLESTTATPTETVVNTESTTSDTSTSTTDSWTTVSVVFNSTVPPMDSTIKDVTSFGGTTFTEDSSNASIVATTDSTTDSYQSIGDISTDPVTSIVVLLEERHATVPPEGDGVTGSTQGSAVSTIPASSTKKYLAMTDNRGTEDLKLDEQSSQTRVPSLKGSVTVRPTTILMPDDILVMNVTVKTNVSVGHIHGVTINPVRLIRPDVEAILNITQREKGEDYDYDYSEPTLPPSLPNVRIIPFVAADALVKDNTEEMPSAITGYPAGSVGVPPEMRPTDASNFFDIVTRENRFSPPVETEGGFVPREPSYFEAPFHSTDLNLEIGTGVTILPAAITNPDGKNDEGPTTSHCLFEGREYSHGELLPSNALCILCLCYYGEVICSDEKCPPLKIGCRRVSDREGCCGKVICVDAEESPTVVLDRADATASSQRQPIPSVDGIVSPDPFRDVIKTEPAPDLPSLIEDMIPYLAEHGIATPRPTTPVTTLAMKPNVSGFATGDEQHFKDFIGEVPLPPDRKYGYNEEGNYDSFGTGPSSASKTKETRPYGVPGSEGDREKDSSFGFGYNSATSGLAYDKQTLTRMDYTTSKVPEKSSASSVESQNDLIASSNDSAEFGSNSSVHRQVSTSTSASETPSKHESPDNEDRPSLPVTDEPLESEEEADGSVFSLGSAFDLFFSDSSSTTSKPPRTTTTRPETFSASSSPVASPSTLEAVPMAPKASIATTTEAFAKTTVTSPQTKVYDNEVPIAVASLLKLAGCNIYGRMYRVGRIITELSGPCLECRCTEVGVQCEQLQC